MKHIVSRETLHQREDIMTTLTSALNKKTYLANLKKFIVTSQKRREQIHLFLIDAMRFAQQWDTEPLTALWTAIEELRSDDRRAILTWITLASGGYDVHTTTFNHSINQSKAIFYREKGATRFLIRKLAKSSGETQEKREKHLDSSIRHYTGVKWYSLAPEKTDSVYKFGLDAYLQRALKNENILSEKDRLFLRDVLRVASDHGRKIEVA